MLIATLCCVMSQKIADLNFRHVASSSLVSGCQLSKGNTASLFGEKLISDARVGVHTQTTFCHHSLNTYKPNSVENSDIFGTEICVRSKWSLSVGHSCEVCDANRPVCLLEDPKIT
jgi:hypothetical protein